MALVADRRMCAYLQLHQNTPSAQRAEKGEQSTAEMCEHTTCLSCSDDRQVSAAAAPLGLLRLR
jgi:hypothetical protein